MKYLLIISSIVFIYSCSEKVQSESLNKIQKEKTEEVVIDKTNLIKNDGDFYTEYYPNGVSIKFRGPQDKEKKRHGKWLYFSPEGLELSMTMYSHGKKHGHSIVHYPNGSIYYLGEYEMDEKIGIWKSYDRNGAITSEKNYSEK